MTNQQKKYTPDLRSFMAVSTSNYAKILRLFPNIQQISENHKVGYLTFDNQPDLVITILQASRYTQTFSFIQKDSKKHLNREFCIRVYHDAQLAEVLSGVHDSMLPPVYKVPNPEMKQVDEKAQLNRFLGEWLSFCLEYGTLHSDYRTQLAFLS